MKVEMRPLRAFAIATASIAVASASQLEDYDFFDFLGDMVEMEEGVLDPLAFEALDVVGDADGPRDDSSEDQTMDAASVDVAEDEK